MSDVRRRCRIGWLDTKTGKIGVYLENAPGAAHVDGPDDISIWWWTDGNGGCDCNRVGLLLQVDGGETPCGDDRVAITRIDVLEEDGTIIHTFDNLRDLNGLWDPESLAKLE